MQKHYISLYCSARDGDHPFVHDYTDQLGDIDMSPTGVIRIRTADQLDLTALTRMYQDLQRGLAAGTLTLQYGRTAHTLHRTQQPR